jgi:hypothetical protein
MTTEKKEAAKPEPKKTYKASPGHVIVEVLKPHAGMTRELTKGDIIEIPERQAGKRSRGMREGLYKLYTKGDKKPMHR